MLLRKKGLKIVGYVFLGIFLMSFFLFISTYDFTPKKTYSEDILASEVQQDFQTKLIDAMGKSHVLNFLPLEIDSDTLSKYMRVLRKTGEEYLYSSYYWDLKGINIEIENKMLVGIFYLNFHDKIKYQVKVKAYFTFSQTNDEYSLRLNTLQVGAFVIPSSMTKKFLSSTNERSIGAIMANAMDSIPFGTYDKSQLSFMISQDEIINGIEKGLLGELLYGDDTNKKTIISVYISSLFKNQLISLSIHNTLNISMNYLKILSSSTRAYFEGTKDYIQKGAKGVRILEDNLILNYLCKGQSIAISQETVAAFSYLLVADQIKDETAYSFSFGDIYNFFISINGNTCYIAMVYKIASGFSRIDLTFTNTNVIGSTYHLDKATIGYDQGEGEESYLFLDQTPDLFRLVNLLVSLGFSGDPTKLTIELDDVIFRSLRLPYIGFTVYDDKVTLITKENPYARTISSALLDNSANSVRYTFPYYGIQNKIDWKTIDTILASFDKELNDQEKVDFLTGIRDYFLERDTNVYNYLKGIIGEE